MFYGVSWVSLHICWGHFQNCLLLPVCCRLWLLVIWQTFCLFTNWYLGILLQQREYIQNFFIIQYFETVQIGLMLTVKTWVLLVCSLNLVSWSTNLTGFFHCFSYCFQAGAWIVPWNRLWLLSFKSISTCHPLSFCHFIKCCITFAIEIVLSNRDQPSVCWNGTDDVYTTQDCSAAKIGVVFSGKPSFISICNMHVCDCIMWWVDRQLINRFL